WAVPHDVRSGQASTVLAGYLADNVGVSALSARRVTGFSVVDTTVGDSSDWSARLQPLDELTRRLCADAVTASDRVGPGMVCRLSADKDGQIVARLELARDVSERYLLSDKGDDFTSVR